GPGRGWSRPVSGGYGEGETPLPIPNRAVKPLSADGTWPARAWESRSPPVYLHSTNDRNGTMTDARRGQAHPGARGNGSRGDGTRGDATRPARHPVASFFRANPQVFVLLIICLVLGLGTFFAVLFGLVTAHSDQTTGEPSGAILGGVHAALGVHTTLTTAPWLSL